MANEKTIRYDNPTVEMLTAYFHSNRDPQRLTPDALVEYLKKYEPEEDHLYYAAELLRCPCCPRHMHYKEVPKPENPAPESLCNFEAYCVCPCRAWYRAFKRHGLV